MLISYNGQHSIGEGTDTKIRGIARELRKRPTQICLKWFFSKVRKQFTGGRIDFSTNSAGATIHLGIYLREMKTYVHIKTCKKCSQQHYLQLSRHGNNLSVHQQINEVVVYMYIYIYTHTHNWILFSHKKEWNFSICSNMYGLWGLYAKWNKSHRGRQIL